MNKPNAQVMNDLLNISAIMMKDPEGAAVLGVWHSMEAIATVRPDGCVCLAPGVPMTAPDIAAYFHFPVALVEKTVAWLQKLGRLTLADGLLQFCSGKKKPAEKELTPEENAKQMQKREQTRLRVARFRELKKETAHKNYKTQAAPVRRERSAEPEMPDGTENYSGCVTEPVTEKVTHAVTQCVTLPVTQPVTHDAETRAAAGVSGNSETLCNADGNADKNSRANTINNDNNIFALSANRLIDKLADKTNGKSHTTSPKNLSDVHCRILDAWNKLPLPKYHTLTYVLRRKLDYLLQRYGEEIILKTIAGIANSAFLLGKKVGSCWSATFGWLLEPGNFAKVLAGNYRDKTKSGSACDTWNPGEPCPFFLPGEGEERFTPEEADRAMQALSIPTTPAQIKAARLLGLPGYEEAIA